MPASKAQQKAVTKYVKAKYDRFGLTMPKGELDDIKAHAAAHGESVNGFIGRTIKETISRDGAEKLAGASEQPAAIPLSPASPNAAQAVSAPAITISPDKLNQAKAHAEARREPLSGFLVRAIDETIERDRSAPAASQGDSKGEST